jgi:hypothetical protein
MGQAWSKCGSRWTHELIAYALDQFHKQHLRTPTVAELRSATAGLPSHPTVRRMYGCAGNMYRAHGYLARPAGGQLDVDYHDLRDEYGRFRAVASQ